MLQYKDNKKKLQQYINEHQEFFKKIDEDTLGAANALLGSKIVPPADEVEKGEINMCKALDDLYQDGVNEGREVGEKYFGQLCSILLEEGKTEELKRAIADHEYREMLYQEYKIN